MYMYKLHGLSVHLDIYMSVDLDIAVFCLANAVYTMLATVCSLDAIHWDVCICRLFICTILVFCSI